MLLAPKYHHQEVSPGKHREHIYIYNIIIYIYIYTYKRGELYIYYVYLLHVHIIHAACIYKFIHMLTSQLKELLFSWHFLLVDSRLRQTPGARLCDLPSLCTRKCWSLASGVAVANHRVAPSYGKWYPQGGEIGNFRVLKICVWVYPVSDPNISGVLGATLISGGIHEASNQWNGIFPSIFRHTKSHKARAPHGIVFWLVVWKM